MFKNVVWLSFQLAATTAHGHKVVFASAPVASSLWDRDTNAWTGPTCGNQLFVTQMTQLLMQRACTLHCGVWAYEITTRGNAKYLKRTT